MTSLVERILWAVSWVNTFSGRLGLENGTPFLGLSKTRINLTGWSSSVQTQWNWSSFCSTLRRVFPSTRPTLPEKVFTQETAHKILSTKAVMMEEVTPSPRPFSLTAYLLWKWPQSNKTNLHFQGYIWYGHFWYAHPSHAIFVKERKKKIRLVCIWDISDNVTKKQLLISMVTVLAGNESRIMKKIRTWQLLQPPLLMFVNNRYPLLLYIHIYFC